MRSKDTSNKRLKEAKGKSVSINYCVTRLQNTEEGLVPGRGVVRLCDVMCSGESW
jgi:hypothetical protein